MEIREVSERFNLEVCEVEKNRIKVNFRDEKVSELDLVHMFQMFTVCYEKRIFRVVFNSDTKDKTLHALIDTKRNSLYLDGHLVETLMCYKLIYTDFYKDSDMMIEF